MVISIEQWRAKIGLFISRTKKKKDLIACAEIKVVNYKVFLLIIMFLLTHGYMESNPSNPPTPW